MWEQTALFDHISFSTLFCYVKYRKFHLSTSSSMSLVEIKKKVILSKVS